MRIGIIAYTHDRLPFIDRAVQKLNKEKVELVLHAGDYIAPFVASRFKPMKSRMIGVFGNNDAEREMLKKFNAVGIQIHGRFAEVRVEDLKIALLHGEEINLLESLINSYSYDVIVHGHTHQAGIFMKNGTLIVNPGEVCGYLSERATIALLNRDNGCKVVPSLSFILMPVN